MTYTWYARIRRSLRECTLKPSFGLICFEEGFCLDFFGFLISLPFLDRWHYQPEEILDRWSLMYYERSMIFEWGPKFRKSWAMPWDYVHIRHDVLRPDGTWSPYVGSWEERGGFPQKDGTLSQPKEPDGRKLEAFPYRYVLKSGEVQLRQATVYVERYEWRQKWLAWCPWFAKVRTSIEVEFDGEAGERSGSWKGGCVGCGYDLKPGETPEQALRRMEAERKF